MTTPDIEVSSYPPVTAITRREEMAVTKPATITELLDQVALIQTVMHKVMKEGEHYGVIPGCGTKPSLLKAGAEKLMLTFRLVPTLDEQVIDMADGHREYRVKCTIHSIGGSLLGQGVGSASTMEGKWRFRTGPKKSTGKPVPKEYWDLRKSDPVKAQALIGGKGFVTSKEDGVWEICEQGEKVEHDNPADYYNTCLKMAKKRALVDATLTCTAASDCFSQDVEELVENGVIQGEAKPVVAETSVPRARTRPPIEPPKRQTEEPSDEEIANAFLPADQDGDNVQDDIPGVETDADAWLEEVKRTAIPFGKDADSTFGAVGPKGMWWWVMVWAGEPLKPYEKNGKTYPIKDSHQKVWNLLRKHRDQLISRYNFQPAKQ